MKQYRPPHPVSECHEQPHERLAEIGEILAAGMVRLRARQSRKISADGGESSLAGIGHRSGHPNPEKRVLEVMG